MTLVMFDSVSLDQIPANPQAVAAYVDGRFANAAEAVQRFPHAHILTIAVSAAHDADTLDIETGDATPAQAAAWYARQRARGVTRPCLYASASIMQADVVPALHAAGITLAEVRLWSAHYTEASHICGPSTCKAMSIAADGTQWTPRAMGRNLDESLLADDFFGTPPPPKGWTAAMINDLPTLRHGATDRAGHVFYVHRLQALLACVGQIKAIPSAAAIIPSGTFDAGTTAAVKAIQGSFGLAQDGSVGPLTWMAIIAGQHG